MPPLKYPAARSFFAPDDIDTIKESIADVLNSGRLILGEHTKKFEDGFSQHIGVKHAIAVNSCTSALQIALRYYNVKGKKVIVPTNNFVGGIAAVLYEGGIPILADMDPDTFCIDIDDVIRKTDDETVAVILVHIAGLITPDFQRLKDFCKQKELILIEDAAHAPGAQLNQHYAGSLGDVGCFSFYPTKNLTTCTGGMITTNDPELEKYAKYLRHHGFSAGAEGFTHLGNDWCMSEVHAVLGCNQLSHLSDDIKHRNQLVESYKQEFKDDQWLTIPEYPDGIVHAYYKFPILLDPKIDRNQFRKDLYFNFEIEAGSIYYPPCHQQDVLKGEIEVEMGDLKVSETILERQICPPIHASIRLEDVPTIAHAFRTTANKLLSA